MIMLAKKLGIATLAAATILSPMASSMAQAGDGYWAPNGQYKYGERGGYYTPDENPQYRYGKRGGYYNPGGEPTYRYGKRGGYYNPGKPVYRHGKNGGYKVPQNKAHRDNKDAIVLGIIGLGVGAIIGGALANQGGQPTIVQSPAPRPVYKQGSLEPWTTAWFDYCSNKYRTFSASTGKYRGYDGQDHFCVAR